MKKKRLMMITAGVMIGLAAVLFYLWQKGDQQIKEKFMKKYQLEEQQRLGIDCLTLDAKLQEFVNTRLKSIVDKGQAREKWTIFIDEKLLSEVGRYRENSYQCWRLLSVDKTNQAFLNISAKYREINDSISLIDVIFRYMVGPEATKSPLEVQFARLVDAYQKITESLREIKKSKESK
jgi:hypothetical protein